MKKVLIVSGFGGPVEVPGPIEVHHVHTVKEAHAFFNGEPGVSMLAIGAVDDAPAFVRDIRGRFPELPIVSVASNTLLLANAGCNCFVRLPSLGQAIRGFLLKPH